MLGNSSYYLYPTPFGPVTIGVRGHAVCAVYLGTTQFSGPCKPTLTSNQCANQLMEYFAGKRTIFNLKLEPSGSDFQKQVWNALQHIPYGQTRTNKEIAELCGNPEAYKMVGMALRNNPIAVIIPAHRVVGANGKPTGANKEAQMRRACLLFEQQQLTQSK